MTISLEATAVAAFTDEFRQSLPAILDALDAAERDPSDRSATHEAYRLIHALKGAASMVGLAAFGYLLNVAEELIEGSIAGPVPMTAEIVTVLRASMPRFALYMDHALAGRPVEPVALDLARALCLGGGAADTATLHELIEIETREVALLPSEHAETPNDAADELPGEPVTIEQAEILTPTATSAVPAAPSAGATEVRHDAPALAPSVGPTEVRHDAPASGGAGGGRTRVRRGHERRSPAGARGGLRRRGTGAPRDDRAPDVAALDGAAGSRVGPGAASRRPHAQGRRRRRRLHRGLETGAPDGGSAGPAVRRHGDGDAPGGADPRLVLRCAQRSDCRHCGCRRAAGLGRFGSSRNST